jgi:hypothetical protein
MSPASIRYIDGLRKWRGKAKPLSDVEQRILDACLWRQGLIKYTADYKLTASAALFPATVKTDSTPSIGMPVKALAPLFGMTPRAIRSAIGTGVFPIPTYLDQGRRYADRQVVKDYFAAKQAASSAALADAT